MDRILDSGSNDWGSTPHGRTYKGVKESVSEKSRHALFFVIWYCAQMLHLMSSKRQMVIKISPIRKKRTVLFYPLQISSAGRAVAVFHTRQPTQRATSRATAMKMPT